MIVNTPDCVCRLTLETISGCDLSLSVTVTLLYCIEASKEEDSIVLLLLRILFSILVVYTLNFALLFHFVSGPCFLHFEFCPTVSFCFPSFFFYTLNLALLSSLSLSLSLPPSVCLSVCLSFCLSLSVSLYLSLPPSLPPPPPPLSLSLSDCLVGQVRW